MKVKKRIVIVDHMAALRYGHNLPSVKLFCSLFKKHFDQVICLVSKELPKSDDDVIALEKVLVYPYNRGLLHSKKEQTVLVSFARRIVLFFLGRFLNIDPSLKTVLKNWKNIWGKYNISKNDCIFLPSADYYGTMCLLNVIEKLSFDKVPKIFLRFIGVMERSSYSNSMKGADLFRKIAKLKLRGYEIEVAAETPIYSNYLSQMFGMVVDFMPYPLVGDLLPLSWDEEIYIVSPGQGRMDKGYHTLIEIITCLKKVKLSKRFKFVIQSMRKNDRYFSEAYQSKLIKNNTVLMKPEIVSDEEIANMYKKADILIMPYCPEVYAMRGSAVFQEGIAAGRVMVVNDGLGFSDLVNRYNNGYLADDINDFALKIQQLMEKPKKEIEEMAASARSLYEKDFERSFAKLVKWIKND